VSSKCDFYPRFSEAEMERRRLALDDAMANLFHMRGRETVTARGRSPAETAMDLVVEDGSRAQVIYFLMSEDNVRRQVALPWMSFGSDSDTRAVDTAKGAGLFQGAGVPAAGDGRVIRVLLADDQALVRAGFRMLLMSTPGMEVVGGGGNGVQAVGLAQSRRPDVILMDMRMPVLDGLEATRRICADTALSDVRVLILTTFQEDEYVFDALRAGASGFVLKDVEPPELLQAVRVIAAGEALLSPSVTRRQKRATSALRRIDHAVARAHVGGMAGVGCAAVDGCTVAADR